MGVDREGGDTAAYGQVGRKEDRKIILLWIKLYVQLKIYNIVLLCIMQNNVVKVHM